jgi:hypothetical protein
LVVQPLGRYRAAARPTQRQGLQLGFASLPAATLRVAVDKLARALGPRGAG